MKTPSPTRYCTLLIIASLAAPQASFALGVGQVQQAPAAIQQQTPEPAGRLIQRIGEAPVRQSIPERRLDLPAATPQLPGSTHLPALPRLPGSPETVGELLPQLPERVNILNGDGTTVFDDVRVEGGWRAVERQWLVVLSADEVGLLAHAGIKIIEQTPLADLDLLVVRFEVARELDSYDAMSRLLPSAVLERLDRNHIYSPQSSSGAMIDVGTSRSQTPASRNDGCERPVTVGMIDTAIDTSHPSLRNSDIVQKNFLPDMNQPVGHGTAVASALVGQLPGRSKVQLSRAKLINASVFFGREDLSPGATLMNLVEGLNWLVAQKVGLINISMAGPDNRLLALVTQRVTDAGIPLVAAVGNQGPAAPPLYPAAYAHVIGVTAVDGWREIYRWANQGTQVDFAAHGVDVVLAAEHGGFSSQSGTSLATPIVTAGIACLLAGESTVSPGVAELVQQLADQAIDLGEVGRDAVFGHGLLK